VKPPLIVGLAVTVLIVALGLLAPAMRSAASRTAEEAQAQAALAQRKLARYSLTLPQIARLIDLEAMKKSDLSDPVRKAEEQLKQTAADSAELARKATQMATQLGLPKPVIGPLTADEGGVKAAAARLQQAIEDNDKLLKEAVADGKAAVGTDGNALGVSEALGMAEYVRAAGLLAEAENMRVRQADLRATLLDVAARWQLARSYREHFHGLDVQPILAGLRSDLDELATMRAEAAQDLAALRQDVAEREEMLAAVVQELSQTQQEFEILQRRGFQAGQEEGDAGFVAYREQFLALSERLRRLEQEEQILRYGGQRGAELIGDDPLSAEIRGGEAVTGLEELQRRLERAQERARRLDRANISLEDHIKYVSETGQRAQADADHYQQRLSELTAEQKRLVEEIQGLEGEAFAKESEALSAAEAAARAFAQAQRAAQSWMQAHRQLQQERDPSRKNERLLVVTRDPYLEQVARSAEAAARLLVGRIHLSRMRGTQGLIADMRLLAEINRDFSFDAAPFETRLSEARAAAIDNLSKSRELYASVAERLANQPTVWVPLGALAAVNHLLGLADESQAELHNAHAVETIQKALDKREQFPYARPLALFREHLLSGRAPAPVEPEQAPAGKPDESKGFFLDDEEQ